MSLKNRFNKVLQAEINKYIGHLHSALREYHSGWSMGDYVAKAKAQFHLKTSSSSHMMSMVIRCSVVLILYKITSITVASPINIALKHMNPIDRQVIPMGQMGQIERR